MNRFKYLLYKNSKIIDEYEIIKVLERLNFNWLIDSETENAEIEIKKDTIIWHGGYFYGNWKYGIFKKGIFHGVFENGIFENGEFKGEFESGIKN